MWRATVAGAGGGSRHTAASWRLGIPGGSVAHSLPSGACGARQSLIVEPAPPKAEPEVGARARACILRDILRSRLGGGQGESRKTPWGPSLEWAPLGALSPWRPGGTLEGGVCLVFPQRQGGPPRGCPGGVSSPAVGQEPGNRNPNEPNELGTHFSHGGLPRPPPQRNDGAPRGWGEHVLPQSTKLPSVTCLEETPLKCLGQWSCSAQLFRDLPCHSACLRVSAPWHPWPRQLHLPHGYFP